MLDLINIARTEADGGDLHGLLSGLFEPSEIRPTGYPDAVIWQGGNFASGVNPVASRTRSNPPEPLIAPSKRASERLTWFAPISRIRRALGESEPVRFMT